VENTRRTYAQSVPKFATLVPLNAVNTQTTIVKNVLRPAKNAPKLVEVWLKWQRKFVLF